MLEAIDIILICLGSVVTLFALFAVFLLLSVRRNSAQAKKAGSEGVASKRYYLEQPPSIGAALKNGTAPAVSLRPAADTVVRPEDAELTKAKPSPEVDDLLVLKVEELSEVRRSGRQEEVHRGAHSIKRTHRPCKIKLSPGTAKAAHAEAVQTEHAVGSFLADLSRIRSADDTVFFEEFQILEASDTVRERKRSAAEKSRALNRFVDILPNDDTRVILRGPKDYINASLIDGYRIAGQFIATQGPIGPEELSDGRKESTVSVRLFC
ncbi:unnamed protein product [Heligmosomoides polygyrus]|uniref:protein-tyrosine-phosphatase n=1 Tax=Heligmosomoides polygyrus TaxID=6339 RepID=A0A3P8DUJ2_HELPZ|nr:unnamed protein product [Heligmosomoides polygyrus]